MKDLSTQEDINSVEISVRGGRNGGTLLNGSNYGNKGGGRRPDHLRAQMREDLATAMELLRSRLSDPFITTSDLLRAIELYSKFAIGPAQSEHDWERPKQTVEEAKADAHYERDKEVATITNPYGKLLAEMQAT